MPVPLDPLLEEDDVPAFPCVDALRADRAFYQPATIQDTIIGSTPLRRQERPLRRGLKHLVDLLPWQMLQDVDFRVVIEVSDTVLTSTRVTDASGLT